MTEYRMEWQKAVQGEQGSRTRIIDLSETIIISQNEKDPDKIAKRKAKEIFSKLGVSSATLKKIVCRFPET